jgi:hypothetical protein
MILEYIVSYPQQSKASEHEQHSLDQLGELTGHNAIRYCHCSSGKLAVNGTYIHSKTAKRMTAPAGNQAREVNRILQRTPTWSRQLA